MLLFRLFGALGLVLVLLSVTPQQANAQQRGQTDGRLETPRTRPAPDPLDRHLPAPTDADEVLIRQDDTDFALRGGGTDAGAVDAAIDAMVDTDAGQEARPPPPIDDASCQVAGGADGGLALVAFMFAAGVLFRRRD